MNRTVSIFLTTLIFLLGFVLPGQAKFFEQTGPYSKGNAASTNPWRYATKYLDAETGLYYFGQRYLDPITGQWLSREPLGEGESVNLYSYAHNDPLNQVDRLGLEAVPVDATLNNGIPSMIYEEWAGSGLAYMWNALAAGEVKSWVQSPDEGQLRRCFYYEEGRWHLRTPGARRNAHTAEAIAAIPAKMEEIAPILVFCERGGTIAAALPLVAAAGSVEVGAAVYVYGGHALNSFAVKSGLALLGTQAAFEFATDESVRNETIAAIASDPNGVRATGELLAVGARGLARMGPRAASLWDTVADGLYPSYGGMKGFAPGGVINPFGADTAAYSLAKHGDMPVPRLGQQSHHGAMSAWMKNHFTGYDPNKAPAILMPEINHRATFGIYNTWRAKMRTSMGGTFDWKNVSEIDMRNLSEEMFDVSGVPEGLRKDYWNWFERMKGALGN